IRCSPVTWPIGMGRRLKGIYHVPEDRIYVYSGTGHERASTIRAIDGLDSPEAAALLGDELAAFREEIELVRGACPAFDAGEYLAARQTPMFFGSAIANFGVRELLDAFVQHAPPPRPRESNVRRVEPQEGALTGFVFKIQANMDPAHRDRIAFLRICSGRYEKGMKIMHVRSGKS